MHASTGAHAIDAASEADRAFTIGAHRSGKRFASASEMGRPRPMSPAVAAAERPNE